MDREDIIKLAREAGGADITSHGWTSWVGTQSTEHRAELAALRVVALEDILNTSNAELRKEAVDDGEDVAAVAADLKAAMRESAAAALRARGQA